MIYFDHAATTPVDPRVFEKMKPYFTENFGNPNSQHSYGRRTVTAVDDARDTVARLIGAKPNEIYFTSGGTESDNWALRGAAHAYANKGKHLIVSAVEHPAVLSAAKELQKEGFEVTFAAVDEYGTVDLAKLKEAIRPDTTLIGVMTANNEIGTLQPVREISALARERGILFFTDAVQAAGAMPLNVREPGVDMLSFSGHKFYGPKGVGVLYVRSGLRIGKLIAGGHQERSMRGGTTNVPGVVGLAEAFRLANEEMAQNNAHVAALRDRFIARVLREIPYVKLNGHPKNRLPNNANFSFRYIEGESLLFSLDLAGIAVSSGSACSSGSLEPSHVLLATGLPEGLAHGSIRFSFGKENTAEEVDFAVDKLKEIVVRLRALSPLFPKELKNEVYEKEI
ncbi:MAG TPA: cysteine desulfurase NifS [Candidatus Borkfalkia excrementigallinarum]|uniref:Cysteine desulfurase IscS n=1 Tax=Candidatus Borkfalkia excrementigallinarum TaxID=2838506 RepID=A0A9D1ZU88_9FIRM|nr:cysteine desulfurase NifS [Candidatus Borkfalkia excrementigallinarum]